MHRLTLTPGRWGAAIRQQIGDLEGIGMGPVSIQCQQQGRPLLHNPDTRVPVAVDPPLVTLGPAEPALQLQVVLRQFRFITADEQPTLEARHDRGEVLPDRGTVGLEVIPQGLVLGAPLETTSLRRLECGLDRGDVRYLPPDGRLDFPHQVEAAIETTGQPPQQRLGPPPLRASRFRCSD